MMEPNQAIQYRSRFDCTSHLPSIRVIDFNHIPGSGASIASSKVAPRKTGIISGILFLLEVLRLGVQSPVLMTLLPLKACNQLQYYPR